MDGEAIPLTSALAKRRRGEDDGAIPSTSASARDISTPSTDRGAPARWRRDEDGGRASAMRGWGGALPSTSEEASSKRRDEDGDRASATRGWDGTLPSTSASGQAASTPSTSGEGSIKRKREDNEKPPTRTCGHACCCGKGEERPAKRCKASGCTTNS